MGIYAHAALLESAPRDTGTRTLTAPPLPARTTKDHAAQRRTHLFWHTGSQLIIGHRQEDFGTSTSPRAVSLSESSPQRGISWAPSSCH